MFPLAPNKHTLSVLVLIVAYGQIYPRGMRCWLGEEGTFLENLCPTEIFSYMIISMV